jgi:hypothetical protein
MTSTGMIGEFLDPLAQRYLTSVAADKHFSDAASPQWW